MKKTSKGIPFSDRVFFLNHLQLQVTAGKLEQFVNPK